ncbi:tetratricopeptide (TPR) repeat protein [Lewinella aquimaris]|uniref:Tetratricopeptide (TPR) repeat protein n=1 Tax=Neolewinella aquimaris TaxID=1835722 RepID=A0A840E3C6_9BACT|nr:hypothetical protein [Neolewinella aquimaris]MBB4079590.1 tetratricopeptide (TPR) repeat protein [Neolewinella aquimaris]
MQDGHFLTQLIQHYSDYREEYLMWAKEDGHARAEALVNYRRALVAWYEASIDEDDPYRGELLPYVTAIARVYFGKDNPTDRPIGHFPRTVKLSVEGQELLRRFQGSGTECRELLLLADYHRLSDAALSRAFSGDETGEPIADRVLHCRADLEQQISDASLLWPDVVTVAGRLDLIETLEREESRRTELSAPAPPPTAASEVKLSPRYRPSLSLPAPGMVVAAVVFGIFLWLMYDTFGQQTPDELYTEYFTPYPNVFTDVPPETEGESDLQRILYDYDRGDYHTAYEELLPTADAYPAAPLYLGVSALALGDPARAREWFERVDPLGPYADAAEWYRALALMGTGDTGTARVQLEAIGMQAGHPYASAARNLLREW